LGSLGDIMGNIQGDEVWGTEEKVSDQSDDIEVFIAIPVAGLDGKYSRPQTVIAMPPPIPISEQSAGDRLTKKNLKFFEKLRAEKKLKEPPLLPAPLEVHYTSTKSVGVTPNASI
jgi:hypothetical protein